MTALLVGLGLIVFVGAAALMWLRRRGRSTADAGPPERSTPEATAEQRAFVRGLLEAHREAFLAYAIWVEGTRRGLYTDGIEAMLGGRPLVLSAPVLAPASAGWAGSTAELEDALGHALREFGLEAPEDAPGDARARASEACRLWAEREAARIYDAA